MDRNSETLIDLGTASVLTQGNNGVPIEAGGLLRKEGISDD
ncbi:hypothetical protein BH09PSE3_BH09PSE3_15270 [soil metagenome]|jgi:hypothetical protein